MQLSKYNIYINDDDKIQIFNTLTHSFVRIKQSDLEDAHLHESQITQKLLDMGILINQANEDVYKYKYLHNTKKFRQDVLFIYVCPTTSCNFSCSYCFEGEKKTLAYMNNEVENAVIEYISKYKGKDINIVWFGGEPLLGLKHIVRIDKELKEKDVKYTSSMITNGSLLTEKNVTLLKDLPLDFIQISMDGVKEVQDSRRFFHSGKGSFDFVMKGIDRLLSKTSIHISIQVAVDKQNIDSYENLLEYMNTHYPKEMDEKRIDVSYNVIGDRTNFDNGKICFNHAERFEYIKHINQLNIINKKAIGLPGLSQPCMYRSTNSFAIDAEGYLYKCLEHVGKPKYAVGNLLKQKVSLSKLAECAFSFSAFDNKECVNCPVFPICGGGCPTDRIKEKGKNFASCSFYKEYITNILSIIK